MANIRLGLVVLALVVIGIVMSVFYVDQRELAIKFRFGEIVASELAPGAAF